MYFNKNKKKKKGFLPCYITLLGYYPQRVNFLQEIQKELLHKTKHLQLLHHSSSELESAHQKLKKEKDKKRLLVI